MKMERQMLSVAYDIKHGTAETTWRVALRAGYPGTGVTEVGRRLVQYDRRIDSSFQSR
jgi:TPP-dependent indolepyruvate ferredoxin oxidoreductase alpha subunit